MIRHKLTAALIFSTYACAGFSATLTFQSETPDKELDGVHSLTKLKEHTYQSEKGQFTYHKTKSVKQAALIPGEVTYEGIHQVKSPGKPEVLIHYVGLIHKNGSEHGTYIKYDVNNNPIGHGHYQYIK